MFNLILVAIFFAIIPKTNTYFDYLIMSYLIVPFFLLVKERKSKKEKLLVLIKVFLVYVILSAAFYTGLYKANIKLSFVQESILDLILITFAINPIKVISYLNSFFTYCKEEIFKNIQSLKNKRINLLNIEEIDRLGEGNSDKGRDFELYIAQVFRKGRFKAFTTDELKEKKDMPKSILERGGRGEQGCDDIVWFKKKQTINGKVCDGFLIQAKQYSGNVPNKAPQEAFGAIPMYEKHFKKKLYPVVVTNSYLTREGYDLAESQETLVVDRDNIIDFFYQGATGKIKKIW